MAAKEITTTFALWWTLLFVTSVFLVVYAWRRRKLYYAAAKLKGPLALPFVGSAHVFFGGHEVLYTKLRSLFAIYTPLAKVWVGPELYFITTRSEDVDVILNNCLEKSSIYVFGDEVLGNGLITAPVDLWRRHRRLINLSFNSKTINSFIEIFNKHGLLLNDYLSTKCAKGKIDMFSVFFQSTLDIVLETLCDVDYSLLKGRGRYIRNVIKFEELILERFTNPLLHFNLVWKLAPLRKRLLNVANEMFDFINSVTELRKSTFSLLPEDDIARRKRFMNQLLDAANDNQLTEEEILIETQTILVSGSETSTITLSFALLVFGTHPDIQEKLFEEINSVFMGSNRLPTLEDLNKMPYLERFLKETLRLLPPIPLIARYVDKDIKLEDSLELPAGSNIFIPIVQMNRRPDIWNDPLKFDPDRFLPEIMNQKHRHAFIPFSHGIRNCIGFKYGMLTMKTLLISFVRNYKVVSCDYTSLEDIEQMYIVLAKPIDGCKVVLEKR